MESQTILVTGAAGFIGARTSELLLLNNFNVIGVDNLNDYDNFKIKEERLKVLPFHKTHVKKTWVDISKTKKLLNW